MELLDIIFSFLALIILEIVLGVDNLVFLSIMTDRLPQEQRKKARQWGLTFAWMTRLALLAGAVTLAKLTRPLFSLLGLTFSIRDIFLIVGGIFLLTKSTDEIHYEVRGGRELLKNTSRTATTFNWVVLQVGLMDIIFSLDSVLTAIGLTSNFWVMAAAITVAILIMLFAAKPVSDIVEKYPTIKMLALSFLMLIGTVLVADGFSFHVPRGYIYFAMGFSLSVEMLNLRRRIKINNNNKDK